VKTIIKYEDDKENITIKYKDKKEKS